MRPQLSIRNILLFIIGALTLLIISLVVGETYTEWQRLSKIEFLKQATLLSDQLFDTEEKLSVERDITYSLLYASDAETMNNLRPHLETSRRNVDETVQDTLSALGKYDFPELADQLQKSKSQFLDLQKLRQQIDISIALPAGKRDHALSQRWFTQATAMTQQTEDLWMQFVTRFTDVDPFVTLHMRFKHLLGIIMEYSGRERSVIGRLLVENVDPTPQEQAQLLQWQGVVDLGWNISDTLANQGKLYPAITPYFKDAKSHYFSVYDMMRDIFYVPGAKHGASYPISVEFWLELATQTTDSLNALKDSALKETRSYVDVLKAKTQREIAINSLFLLFALGLCAYSFLVITRRVIFPINAMVGALMNAIEGKPVSLAPLFQNRQDEIGKLAQVLHVFQENTEKVRQAEKNNALLAAIVESSEDAILSKTLDGIITSWNRGAEHLFGYSTADIVGKHIGIIIPPERMEEESGIISELRRGNRIEHFETVRVRQNGQHIEVSLTVSPIHNVAGEIIGASKIIHNITARKEAEREVWESQERYRALVEASAQVIWTWKEGGIEKMSPLRQWWETTTGQPADDIATFGWLDIVHPDDRDRVKKIWEEAMAKNTNFEMEYRLRARDGKYVHVEIRGVALLAADGSLREFIGSLNDVTARKEAEQEIKDSATRLRIVFDTVLDGLITINSRAIIQSFNAAAERIFGYKAEEVIGQNVKMLMPEPYHGEHDTYVGNYLRTGEAKIIGIGREVTAKRKDGSIFPMELGINAFSVGEERAFVGIIRDITARKEWETRLSHYTKALELSNKELDDFAYIASHDLKEPLRGLHNHARFLLEDNQDKLDADSVSRLGRLSYLSQRMEKLVNDLLYFSRLGRQELAIQPTDINAVIHDIENTLDVLLAERKARIIISEPLPTVICDQTRITEVFRNLITNAIKYNDSPEKEIEIGFLSTQPFGGEVFNEVFYVKDNGRGIAAGFYDEIFRIFKRLQGNNDSHEEGTGVGLTFVKKIIERHGGKIWLQSEVGSGTIFYFTLKGESYDTKTAA